MKVTTICPSSFQREKHLEESKYTDEFFEEFSLRDWVAWNSESGFELFYEDSETIKKIKIKNGKGFGLKRSCREI